MLPRFMFVVWYLRNVSSMRVGQGRLFVKSRVLHDIRLIEICKAGIRQKDNRTSSLLPFVSWNVTYATRHLRGI